MRMLKEQKNQNRRIYWAVVSLVALSCGGKALAQTNNVGAAGSSTNVTQLGSMTIIGKLDQGRNLIIPDLGATAHTFSKEQIQSLSQGDNAPFRSEERRVGKE